MGSAYFRHILRTVKGSLGRFLAIFGIVALGTGFFSGLGTAEKAMLATGDGYFRDSALYNYRAVSSTGFTPDAVESISSAAGVTAKGAYSADILADFVGEQRVLRCLSLTDGLNTPTVESGRLPAAAGECFGDSRFFSPDDVGERVTVSSGDGLTEKELTVVGVGRSPLYLNLDRGTTALRGGKVDAFLLLPAGGFSLPRYTSVYIGAGLPGSAYSDEYEDAEAELLPGIERAVAEAAPGAVTYVTPRSDDVSYASFESDSAVVRNIAKVFPIFFLTVAALVCSTTVTRMLDEERTGIGVLRALGYGKGAILFKYIFYTAGAAVPGCVAGYFAGSWLFPFVIWKAYGLIYGFAPLKYTLSLPMALVSLAGALLCSAGVTLLTCRRRLRERPAVLLRPAAPAPGKRVLLERVKFLWRRLPFLHKVSARNIFRYKKRMIMTFVGIGGCTALVLTGFGIRDSVANIVDYQFDDILRYDLAVSYAAALPDGYAESFPEGSISAAARQSSGDIKGDSSRSATVLVPESGFGELVDLHTESGGEIAFPGEGEAVINTNLARLCGISAGDTVELTLGSRPPVKVTVTALCENYVYNYIYLSRETYSAASGEDFAANCVFIRLPEGEDPSAAAADISARPGVAGVQVTEATRERVQKSMQALNAVVWLVIASAGALALIVLFNLGNINITERTREIATVKVLGFNDRETSAYVFRENRVLTWIGGLLGLPFGVLLHRFVMGQIKIDMVSFRAVILPQSYLFAFLTVAAFSLLSELLMRRDVRRVPMAESLKSTE